MNKEIWENVDIIKGIDFTGDYQVSTYGNVKSLDRIIIRKDGIKQKFKGKMLKPYLASHGYLTVCLSKNGIIRSVRVSRLVLIAFVPNPENKRTGNHKDGKKHDNVVENLEWNTYYENNEHAIRTGLRPVKYNIEEVINDYENGMSSRKIAKKNGVWKNTILNILKSNNIEIRSQGRPYGFTIDKLGGKQ